MFRTPNPNLRRPAYLQSHTKENILFQLMLIPFALAAQVLWDRRQDQKFERAQDNLYSNDKI